MGDKCGYQFTIINRPQFSVIVPTRNRPRLLIDCLESVLRQSWPGGRYEIIVVDDGSRRRTAQVLAPYATSGRIQYLRQEQAGWGAARLLGAQHSRGEILVFLDDDCIAPPGWLASYAQIYAAIPQVAGVAGGLRPGRRMNVAGRKQYRGHIAYFNQLNRPLNLQADQAGRAWFTFGGNRTFRREIWLAVQPAAPHWYFDDYAIDLKLRERDAYIYYEPAAWVAHHYALSLGQRIRAAYLYGRSEGRVVAPAGPDNKISWRGKWRRLEMEFPDQEALDLAWYAITQPLAWIARRAGQRVSRCDPRPRSYISPCPLRGSVRGKTPTRTIEN